MIKPRTSGSNMQQNYLSGKLQINFINKILDPAQQNLWPLLRQIPENFILYGGTAVALRLGHRKSIDFDFFTSQTFLSDDLYGDIEFLKDSIKIQEKPNTLTVLVSLPDFNDPIKISFFGNLNLGQINPPELAENDIYVASLEDLFGMKCATVSQRAEKKDYLDIHAIVTHTDLHLQDGLAAAQAIYGKQYNPSITLKSLVYFEEGNVAELTKEIKDDIVQAVRNVDVENIPVIKTSCIIGEDLTSEKRL